MFPGTSHIVIFQVLHTSWEGDNVRKLEISPLKSWTLVSSFCQVFGFLDVYVYVCFMAPVHSLKTIYFIVIDCENKSPTSTLFFKDNKSKKKKKKMN